MTHNLTTVYNFCQKYKLAHPIFNIEKINDTFSCTIKVGELSVNVTDKDSIDNAIDECLYALVDCLHTSNRCVLIAIGNYKESEDTIMN